MHTEKDSVRQLVKRRQLNCLHLRELNSACNELQLLQFRREATTSFADLRGVLCPLFEDTRPPQPPPPPPPKPKRRHLHPSPFLQPPASAEIAAAAMMRQQRLPALQRLAPGKDIAGCDCLGETEKKLIELHEASNEAAAASVTVRSRHSRRLRRGVDGSSFSEAVWRWRSQLPDFSIGLMKPGGESSTVAGCGKTAAVAGLGLGSPRRAARPLQIR
ncbi:hypothetical protein BOX15_Mlig024297g2 [Macrostomum lignano]|uniref:Uncharacterized protein n=1 Tax=Macrostomum lignano TaxID=282301 RepID=A0A267EGH8_9PLAT|nr:hypothetical protein BOX15_Mlig024297g2 [Macrostomum lignano]